MSNKVTSISDSLAEQRLRQEAAKAAALHAFKTQVRGFAFGCFEKIERDGASRAALLGMLKTVNQDISKTVRAMAEAGATAPLSTRLALNATLLTTLTEVAVSDAPGFGTPALRASLEARFSEELEQLEPLA